MDNIQRVARSANARQKREDQELIRMMSDWAKQKGRVEKEIGRRIDSAHNGNNFKEVRYERNKSVDYKEDDPLNERKRIMSV